MQPHNNDADNNDEHEDNDDNDDNNGDNGDDDNNPDADCGTEIKIFIDGSQSFATAEQQII